MSPCVPLVFRGAMKKILFVFCIIIYTSTSINIHAQTTTNTESTEYKFPQWAMDLRRGEIIAFGIFPFSWLVATTAVDLYRSSQHDWNKNYLPWPVKPAGAPAMTTDEYVLSIGIAAGLSVSLAVVDFFIVQIKRHKKQVQEAKLPRGTPIIKRRNMTTGELIEDPNAAASSTNNAEKSAAEDVDGNNSNESNTDSNVNTEPAP
ncbi:MAG: hypothetical protein Ta2B_23100 [Termitinemataceae bacterium]|nr:MAG: hypothetical protein Ta2B_23100 [Termitinemataceae bacterium]